MSGRSTGKSRTSKTGSNRSNTQNSLVSKLTFKLPKIFQNNSPILRGLSYFDGLEKHQFPNYSSEVESYLDNKLKEDGEKIPVTPFTNHEYALSSALEVLASDKPRLVLVGESGIDKNGMVNYLAEILVNKESKILEIQSDSINSLLSLAKQNTNNAFYSYMFLPNMISHFDVYSLSYRSADGQSSQQELMDHEIAEEYMRDVKLELQSLVRTMSKNNSSDENRKRLKISKEVKKKLITDISSIRKKLNEDSEMKPSNGLIRWLDSMDSYFSKNINNIGYSIEDTLRGILDSKDDELVEDKNIYLWYGQDNIDINTIFTTHRINPTSLDKKVSYITDYNKTLFATFQFDNTTLIPHKDILNIGKLFAGIVTIIPYTNDCINALSDLSSSAHSKSMFLQGLKTGNYILDNEGEKFSVKSKRIIIGFDDVDPFWVLKGGMTEVDETEFRNEIKAIDLYWFIDNTDVARKKTLAIMDSLLDKFNSKHNSGIKFDNTAYNSILQSLVMPSLEVANPKIINAEYADLENKIHEIGLYALTNNVNSVDKKILLKKKLEDIPPNYFSEINSEDRFGWLLNDPEKMIGALNGITVYGDTTCALFKSRSTYYKHKSRKKEYLVELIDTNNGMGDVSASKGQELSSDAFKIMLERYGLGTEYDSFALKTHFKDEWDPDWAGPSASLAVGLSMMSEFTGTPMYQNRVVTGTLDSNQLLAQKIGWPYFKSLSTYRLSQIDPMKREWYFIFPAPNIHDMTKQLALDPFEIEKHVTLLPVRTFEEAYHLMSCGDKITTYDRKYAHELGIQSLEKQLKNIKKLDDLHKNKVFYSIIAK